MKSDVMVIGIPKSGNNVLEKACYLLGLKPTHHKHTTDWHLAEKNKVVYIYRNPRNVLLSAVRYQNEQVRDSTKDISPDKLRDMFYDFFNCSLPYVFRAYEGWMTSNALIIRFEDLISDKDCMDKIADYCGVEKPSYETFKGLYGAKTPTWSGKLSDWQEVWCPEIDKIWKDEGMLEIEQSLGYFNG